MKEKMKVEYIPVSELKLYEKNAKIHTDEQIEQIKKSIKEFGFNDPIAIWHENEIIEGHGRLIAAKQLGMKEVPVIRLDELSDEQRKAYMLVHNKLTMNTDFDVDLLNSELDSITDIDMDFYGFGGVLEIEDIDQDITDPEMPIAHELGEANNYVVLEFKTESEWIEAQRVLGLERVATGDNNPKVRRYGIGHVIDGDEVLRRLAGED